MPKEKKRLPAKSDNHLGTDISISPHQDLYQATVYTWEVNPRKSHKLKTVTNAKLFAQSLGHAAVSLTFPANVRGDELIKQYVLQSGSEKELIPYEKINNKNGLVYKIYFSGWNIELPDQRMYLSSSLISDQLNERYGKNYNYEKYFPEFNKAEIQQRTAKGISKFLNKKLTRLPPIITILNKELHLEIQQYLNSNKKINMDTPQKELKSILLQFKQLEHKILEKDKQIYALKTQLKVKKYKKLSHIISELDKSHEEQDQLKKNQILNKISEKNKLIINEFFEKREEIQDKAEDMFELQENIAELYQQNCKKLNLDAYVKIGHIPQGIIHLPIIDKKNLNHEKAQGLDLEEMLKKMKEIAEDTTSQFDLHKKNCSSTILAILNSGIDPKDKKTIGKHVPTVKDYQDASDPFFKMLTPQSVYNATSSMEEKFMQKQGIKTKEKNIKKAIKKLQNSRKPIYIKVFTRLLTAIKEYFVDKSTLDKEQKLKSPKTNISLLFRSPPKNTTLYKKDAKTEETKPLLPKKP